MKELLDQVLHYLDALWRRRWQVCSVAFMVAALAWAAVTQMPNHYTSSARMYVDTENVLRPLLSGLTVESNLDRQVEVMRQTLLSRPNLEEVARMTDLDVEAETAAAYERLIEELEKDIEITSNRQNIFKISYTHQDPRVARDVVQALTTLFVENNLGENREDIGNAQTFLRKQIDSYEKKLNEAEQRLAEFKQENMAFLPGQSGLQEKLQERRNRLEELRAQLKDARDKRALLKKELAETPKMAGQQVSGSSGPPSNIDVQIMETRGQLEDLKARYTKKHPDVVTLKRRLKRLQQERAQQMSGPGSGSGTSSAGSVPNPVYSNLRMELLRTRSEIQSLEDEVARTEKAVAETERRIKLVPEIEAKLKRLTRDYDVIRSRYQELRKRQETAQITADQDRQGSQFAFRTIESAQVPNLPSGPNRALFLSAGLVGSIGAGMGVAWLLAMVKITYGSVEHLRRDFEIPVIGAVSDLSQANSLTWHNRKEALKIIGLGLVLLASLGGLLYAESRFGLAAVRKPVYGYLAGLFSIGAGLFLFHHHRNRRRLEPEMNGAPHGPNDPAIQTP